MVSAAAKNRSRIRRVRQEGNSAAPHFEYRLQSSSGRPLPHKMPAQLSDYFADGAPVTIGEPLGGQTVHNASPHLLRLL